MKSLKATLPKISVCALFLALAPAALAHTLYVNGVTGNDSNNCKTSQTACLTIGHAISLAKSGDTIKVAPATYTENLIITVSLNILGTGAPTTVVDGNQAGTVFNINDSNIDVLLSNLTIRNGYNQSYGYGGGILNFGTLTVNSCVITGNSASYGGAGIENLATLTINRSTLTANALSYEYGEGGAIMNFGAVTVNQTSITGNTANTGAAIATGCCGSVSSVTTINGSTISGNSDTDESALYITSGTGAITNSTVTANPGGGLMNYGTLSVNNATVAANSGVGLLQVGGYGGSMTLQNTIVAGNTERNCSSGPGGILSNGYNLSDDTTCDFTGPGDLNDTKAKLAPLGNYGGPTQTIREFSNSPTVDAGNPDGCTDSNGNPLTTDQRGYPRPGAHKTDKRCDMGAYERQTD
jgi:hypothetical protein